MTWWRLLRGDPTDLLLDAAEPGLVWCTVVEVVGRPPDAPAVVRGRRDARRRGTAAAILREQGAEGFWGSPSGYGARWSGTAWRLVALACLGADPDDPRVVRGCERLLDVIRPATGGFAAGRTRPESACFTAEVCSALIRFGFGHHPRVREATAWLAATSMGAGWRCPEQRHGVEGRCAVAAVGVLRLVAASSEHGRRQLADLAETAVSSLEVAGVFHDGGGIPAWTQLSHPCLGRVDLLETLYALASGCPGRMGEARTAISILVGLQNAQGQWTARHESPVEIDEGVETAWLTFKAATVLRIFDEGSPGEAR